MTGVGEDGAVLHDGEVAITQHVHVAGDGDEQITDRRRIVGGHDLIALHGGGQGPDRVDFDHHHLGAQSVGTLGDTLTAVAVTDHHHGAAGDQHVGGAQHPVE